MVGKPVADRSGLRTVRLLCEDFQIMRSGESRPIKVEGI